MAVYIKAVFIWLPRDGCSYLAAHSWNLLPKGGNCVSSTTASLSSFGSGRCPFFLFKTELRPTAASEFCTWDRSLCVTTSKSEHRKVLPNYVLPELLHGLKQPRCAALWLVALVWQLDWIWYLSYQIDTSNWNEVRVKQKFRNKINLRLRLEFVGTEMPNWEVKGLNFLSRGKLVGDLGLFILVNFYFLLKELFLDTSVLFKFLHQIILTGSLKLLKYKARVLWLKFIFSAKYRRTNNLPELFRSNVLLVAFGIEFI